MTYYNNKKDEYARKYYESKEKLRAETEKLHQINEKSLVASELRQRAEIELDKDKYMLRYYDAIKDFEKVKEYKKKVEKSRKEYERLEKEEDKAYAEHIHADARICDFENERYFNYAKMVNATLDDDDDDDEDPYM